MCIPSGAKNIPQAYEFINFMVSPEGGGMHAAQAGYNSAAIGAEKALDEAAQAEWFLKLRNQYIDKYQSA